MAAFLHKKRAEYLWIPTKKSQSGQGSPSPLSLPRTPEKVAALYAERYQIYLRAADRRVPVNGTPEDAAEAVLAAL